MHLLPFHQEKSNKLLCKWETIPDGCKEQNDWLLQFCFPCWAVVSHMLVSIAETSLNCRAPSLLTSPTPVLRLGRHCSSTIVCVAPCGTDLSKRISVWRNVFFQLDLFASVTFHMATYPAVLGTGQLCKWAARDRACFGTENCMVKLVDTPCFPVLNQGFPEIPEFPQTLVYLNLKQ